MRIAIILLLLVGMTPVMAITKCEKNGKITYKKGSCPPDASTKIWVKDEYIEESQLQALRKSSDLRADKAYQKKLEKTDLIDEVTEEGIEAISSSNNSVSAQLQKIETLNKQTGKLYAPNMPDDLSEKLQEMERQVQERNEALKKLQAGR